ncbi:MAG: NAD(P)/FAD-dependent oxidoreductase [Pseudomonadota bacterium]
MNEIKPFKVIVVGGGAGGLELAAKLGNKLGKKKKAEITLVDAVTTHLWKPLLHEVAAGTLNSYEDEMSYLALAYQNYFTFRLGRMVGLNREKREITVAASIDNDGVVFIPERSFQYDILVFAVGSETNDFGISGIKEHCMFIDTRVEADVFHQNLLRSVTRANTQETPLSEGQLNVAIAGAGATGVELSAELHNAFEQLIEFGMRNLSRENDINISILEAANRVLPALPPRLSEMTEKALQKIDVHVVTGKRIIEATKDGFKTEDDFIPAAIKVWAAGIKAPDFLSNLDGLETNRINQLVVKKNLQTTRDEHIFAFGDCSACPLDEGENTVPPRAQAAHQQADLLTKSIINILHNKPIKDYQYIDYGSLINLSRYSTVGNMMGNLLGKKAGSLMIEGLLARLIYVSLYLMHQITVKGYVRVFLLTFANIMTRKSKTRMKLH